MEFEKFIDGYLAAWNAKDLQRLLTFFNKRASYYDAFWMEYVSGRDLPQYLRDSLEDEAYWFERVGDVIRLDNSIVSRYTASEHLGNGPGELLFQGAEVFSFRGDKIITVRDHYCDPGEDVLKEVAVNAARHHGETRHVASGLSALRALRFRRLLLDIVIDQKVYLDIDLTQARLAGLVGCSVEHLTQIIHNEFGTNFHNFVDRYRITHAKELIKENGFEAEHTAHESGYQTADEFVRAFRRVTGESPDEFRQRHTT